MRLNVIMPAYNEKQWVAKSIQKVLEQKIPGIESVQLIVVDDGSTDGTKEVILSLAQNNPDTIIAVFHEKNSGKGAAIKTAISKMTADICIIQDADLEYDPADYPFILQPLIEGKADAVYGSRFIGTQPKRVLFFWHYVGNKCITFLSNMFTNLNLTDIETGCKAFRADILKGISIHSKGFEFEPEITAKIAKKGYRIYEAGISYNGRTYREGKKIGWFDGIKAIFAVLRFNLIP